MATEIIGTAFCDKNVWYSSNNVNYAPSSINDGLADGRRWIGSNVDATTSLLNFVGIKFVGPKNVEDIVINFASWGNSIRIGTWAQGADPASASFTKTDIIPLQSYTVNGQTDADGSVINVSTNLRFLVNASQIPGIVLYSDSNSFSALTNTPGSANTNLSINEVVVRGVNALEPEWAKQIGTAICSSQYNDFGTVAAVNDGNTASGWSGGNVGANAIIDWVALQFPSPIKPRKVEFYFYSWGKTIALGYSNGTPTVKGDFTVHRLIDVTVTPTDDLGVPWGRGKVNTLLIPADGPSGSVWGTWTNDFGASIMGYNNGGLDRTRLMELSVYGPVQTSADGLNPKPPAIVPVLPFSATPASWVRTEYNTPGDFVFTPAADTTLVLAIVQAAGSGGRTNMNVNGTVTQNDSTLNGGASTIATTEGLFLTAPGGTGVSGGGVATFNKGIDWLREVDTGSRAGGTSASANTVAGAQSFLTGTVGAAFTMVAQQTNLPATAALNTFTGAGALQLTPIYTGNAARNATYGLSVSAANDSVTLNFKGFAGQQLTVPYNSTGTTQFTVTLNGNAIDGATASSGGFSRTYTLATTGDQTLVLTKVDSSVGTLGIASITFGNFGQAGSISGGSGRLAQAYIIPKVLNVHVGAGGIGQAGGQTVAAAQNGLRGSGGAPGGKGGDGVVVIYEFKGSVVFERPIVPLFPNYNNLTAELVGIYRTNFIGQGLGTKQNYVHKLRPRTKYVYVIMTGAGGGTVNTYTGPSASVPNDPAIVSIGAKTFTAGSGSSSYRIMSGTSGQYPCNAGDGGIFTSNAETIYQTNGPGGSNFASPNSSGVVGNYGWSGGGVQGAGDGINNSAWPGGAAATAMFILSGDDIASGTIDIQVPGGGRAPATGQYDVGNPGAVFIFETESGFGFATTQLSELLLTKSAIAATTVTQTAELVLQKSALGPIRTSQVAELVLVKDTSVPDMQVANVYATLVYDAPPTGMNITQTSELVLQKEKIGGTATTQTAQLVLQKTARSPYRLTQVSELFLVAETPTIFWLNFGTLDNPIRFQLYDSAIGRASSVPPNCKIQIEGYFAEGTHLVINGVPSGIVANVQNNDRVYIHGGVTNYWQKTMPVYAYYEENGETARLLVGSWNINQPVLVPKHTQAYYGSKITPSWLQSRTGFSAAALQSFVTKALMSLVQLTTEAVHNLFGSLVDLIQEKTSVNTRIAEVTIGWDMSKALSKVSDTVVWDYVQALSTDVKNVVTWGTLKAQTSDFKQADFIDTKALYGNVGTSYDVRSGSGLSYFASSGVTLLSTNYAHFELDTTFTQAYYGEYNAAEFVDQKAGYGNVDTEYVYYAVDHSVHYTVVYVAVPSSSTTILFDMEPMSTKAYSVLSGMLWERSVAQGTGHWVIPTDVALHTQTYYGLFGADGVDANSGHSEYTERETLAINGPQQGYFGTTSLWMQNYSAYAERSPTIKRSEKTALFDVTPIKTTAQNGVYNLKPFLDMQSVNQIGPASLYKGFDSLSDIEAFTENFAGVHIGMKYNGYVYTLDVDKSFICEIFNNGPVKWLLQGG
jgi:hypothetical protein